MAQVADTAERPKLTRRPYSNRPKPDPRYAAHKVGPHSRPRPLAKVDKRTKAGQFLHAYEQMLIDHVGGSPSATQRALIIRTARLALHAELLDARALKDGKGLSATDQHFYCVWSNSLARHLAKLGLERPKPKGSTPSSLTKVLEEMR
jgi:hypothetical protein